MEIKLTAEWILDKLSEVIYGDKTGEIEIWAYPKNTSFIELAFKTLEISIEGEEFFDEFDKLIIHYSLTLAEIKKGCPNLYNELYLLSKQEERFCRN